MTHRLTLSAELPYIRHDRIRMAELGEAAESLGSSAGVGDATVLAKYRLGEVGPLGFALIGGLKMPTGSTHRRDAFGERFETEHLPGSGSWDPVVGVSAGAKLGVVDLAASALYEFAGKGAQHTHLGDRFTGGVALSHRFGPAEAEEHRHDHGKQQGRAGSWDAFVEFGGEWEGRKAIAGVIDGAPAPAMLALRDMPGMAMADHAMPGHDAPAGKATHLQTCPYAAAAAPVTALSGPGDGGESLARATFGRRACHRRVAIFLSYMFALCSMAAMAESCSSSPFCCLPACPLSLPF